MQIKDLMKEIEEIKNKIESPAIVGKFHKVSLEQFTKDFQENSTKTDKEVESLYENVLTIPVRSSIDSAGHDFVITKDIYLAPGESVKIHTGIRAEITRGWVLLVMPRSGLGTRYRVQLNNTIGVIDGDYFYTDNEGHIIVTITNDSKKAGNILALHAGDRFLQGLFVPYGITEDDVPLGKRTGGHGSSGLK